MLSSWPRCIYSLPVVELRLEHPPSRPYHRAASQEYDTYYSEP